jgi:hypothetical protein
LQAKEKHFAILYVINLNEASKKHLTASKTVRGPFSNHVSSNLKTVSSSKSRYMSLSVSCNSNLFQIIHVYYFKITSTICITDLNLNFIVSELIPNLNVSSRASISNKVKFSETLLLYSGVPIIFFGGGVDLHISRLPDNDSSKTDFSERQY